MADLVVELRIARSPEQVRRWWWDMPADYRATDPHEQPHRIIVKERTDERLVLATYWRGPMGRDLRVDEVVHFTPDGWSIDMDLPLGLAQRDTFVLAPDSDGTRVRIAVDIWPRTFGGRLAKPFYVWLYAKRTYPATWRDAARLCEEATAPA